MALSPVLLLAASLSTQEAEAFDPTPHLRLVGELHHVTDTFGDDLWPGFDTTRTPIAVNVDDHHEILVNHPSPPEGFVKWEGEAAEGMDVYVLEGRTRYGPRGGGWGVDLGNAYCAYVSQLQEGQEPEDYLSLLLHECFHVYQREFQEPPNGPFDELPELDAEYSGGIGLESRVLAAALAEGLTDEQRRELAKQVVAVRLRRRAGRSDGLVRLEAREEYNEGTATYSQARMMQLIAEQGGLEARHAGEVYEGFQEAGRRLKDLTARILPGKRTRLTFFHSQYQHGMGISLLLDQVRPGWKEEMRAAGETPFNALAREFPMSTGEWSAMALVADSRFDGPAVFAEQQELVDRQHSKLLALLEPEGRRFRIYHSAIPGRFNWKPKGPVHRVPEEMTPERLLTSYGSSARSGGRGATIWEGGLEAFDKPGLSIVTGPTPILFGTTCLEWTDATPEEGLKDVTIEADSQEGDVYTGLRLTTEGLEVTADRARVILEEGLVVVVPVK